MSALLLLLWLRLQALSGSLGKKGVTTSSTYPVRVNVIGAFVSTMFGDDDESESISGDCCVGGGFPQGKYKLRPPDDVSTVIFGRNLILRPPEVADGGGFEGKDFTFVENG